MTIPLPAPGFFTYGAGATLLGSVGYWFRARVDAWRASRQAEASHAQREDELRARIEDAALKASDKVIAVYSEELVKAQSLLQEIRAQTNAKDEAFLKTLSGVENAMEKMAGTMERESQARLLNDQAIQRTLQAMDGRLQILEDRGLRA